MAKQEKRPRIKLDGTPDRRTNEHRIGSGEGRPPYEPSERDRQWVRFCSSMRTPKSTCYELLGIDADTFDKYFRFSYDEGQTELGVCVATETYKRAMGYWTTAYRHQSKNGKLQYHGKGAKDEQGNDLEGEPKMVPYQKWVPGDNQLLLRLFNAWVQKETQVREHTGKDGKDLIPGIPASAIAFMAPNGRETGANGDPNFIMRQFHKALDEHLKKTDPKKVLNGSGAVH